MPPVTVPLLPLTADGKQFTDWTAEEVAAMAIRRRGTKGDPSGHVQYHYDEDGCGCTRLFWCAWEHRFAVKNRFVGAAKSYLDDALKLHISRLLPQKDPDHFNWRCVSCELDGWKFTGALEGASGAGGVEPYPVFDRASLTCVYRMVPYQLFSDADTSQEIDRYVTTPGHPGADVTTETTYIGMPGSMLQFTSPDGTAATGPAGVPIPFAIGFPETQSTWKVLWHRLPEECFAPGSDLFERVKGTATTRAYIGAVNLTEFLGRPPLTVQFTGVEERLQPDPTGEGYSWQLGYAFKEKNTPYGHLGFYWPDTSESAGNLAGYYQAVTPRASSSIPIAAGSIGDGDAHLIVRDLNDLFDVGAI